MTNGFTIVPFLFGQSCLKIQDLDYRQKGKFLVVHWQDFGYQPDLNQSTFPTQNVELR